MMYVIMSDSHGNKDNVKRIIEYSKGCWNIDKFIHLGDGTDDMLWAIKYGLLHESEFIYVKGNCDVTSIREETIIEEYGTKIFITHGHNYSVKCGVDVMYNRAQAMGCSIVLYGHTHMPIITNINGIEFINPGSCKYDPKFALLEVEKQKYYATLIQ